ncbi:hypothetical protein ACWCPM_30740 [Streptomyces sp. NPDC002309]
MEDSGRPGTTRTAEADEGAGTAAASGTAAEGTGAGPATPAADTAPVTEAATGTAPVTETASGAAVVTDTAPVTETAPGTDSAAVTETATGAVAAGVADTAGAAPPRRRGRTALLIAGAAVLGVVAGTCVGYQVQAGREPTPLPPLSQPVVPRATGPAPEPLSAAQDRKVRVDGDLRKLLLKRPAGTKDADWQMGADGWLDITDYAGDFTDPTLKFNSLVTDEFRRAAVVGWETHDSYDVEIRLVQFRQEESLVAADSADNHKGWAEKDDGVQSRPIPGTGEGMAYVDTRPEGRPGYVPVYQAQAHASRGDIAMEIWIYGERPVAMKTIMSLAERQMERL